MGAAQSTFRSEAHWPGLPGKRAQGAVVFHKPIRNEPKAPAEEGAAV